jgi:heme-degrading monooxygenase HmoA
VLHAQLDVIAADPALLGDSVKYIESELRPAAENQHGSLGMSLHANWALGVAVLETFWVSADSLRDSERMVAPRRREAVRRARGTATVEHYRVAVFEREAPASAGAGVLLTRMDVQPPAVADAVEEFGDTAVPSLAETGGFCSALLLADWASGRLATEIVWRDPQALAAGRSATAAIRAQAAAATNCVIRAVDEYSVVFSSARKP